MTNETEEMFIMLQDIDDCIMSLQPVESMEEGIKENLFRCPYCPNNYKNHMSLHLLKLHVKRVHRISCVENFTCPKCLRPVFDSPTVAELGQKDNQNIRTECDDPNIINQGMLIYLNQILDYYLEHITKISFSRKMDFKNWMELSQVSKLFIAS